MAGKPTIIALEELDESVNMLVYGMSGVGKTVFAGSGARVLFLAIESGTISAKRQGSKAHAISIKKWADLQEAYDWLYDATQKPDFPYKWIVIDSATSMQMLLMRGILDRNHSDNPERDLDIPALPDYLKAQNMFQRFVHAFCDLPVNVLFTALEQQAEDEEGDDFVMPDLTGKKGQVSSYVCSLMSCFGRMTVERVKVPAKGDVPASVRQIRQIVWEDNGKVRGKDRYDILGPKTVNKTLAQITRMIETGEKTPPPAAKKVAASVPTNTTTED